MDISEAHGIAQRAENSRTDFNTSSIPDMRRYH